MFRDFIISIAQRPIMKRALLNEDRDRVLDRDFENSPLDSERDYKQRRLKECKRTSIQRRIHDSAFSVENRRLHEDRIVQATIDLLVELFIFVIAVAALIFEVQRSSRSEARKEELKRQEMEDMMRQHNEQLIKDLVLLRQKVHEIEQISRGANLKQKLHEIEQIARGRGLSAVFDFFHAHSKRSQTKN